MIQRFKKKPVVIEALQYVGTEESFKEVKDFCQGIDVTAYRDKKLRVPTLEGFHDASINDWIIKGIKGEFYPCKPDIFAETYELCEIEFPKIQ